MELAIEIASNQKRIIYETSYSIDRFETGNKYLWNMLCQLRIMEQLFMELQQVIASNQQTTIYGTVAGFQTFCTLSSFPYVPKISSINCLVKEISTHSRNSLIMECHTSFMTVYKYLLLIKKIRLAVERYKSQM